MRKAIIMVGPPGSGKTVFLEDLRLSHLAVSKNQAKELTYGLRTAMFAGGEGAIQDGSFGNEHLAVYEAMLRGRLAQGVNVIVNNAHCTKPQLNRTLALVQEYGYEPYILDMARGKRYGELWSQNVGQVFSRQATQEEFDFAWEHYKQLRLPEELLISPEDLKPTLVTRSSHQSGDFDRTIIVGDIHGRYRQLTTLIERLGGLEDELTHWVFVGDYIDRGPNSVGVLELLDKASTLPHVTLLEGNHESHLHSLVYGYGRPPAQTVKTYNELLNAPGWDKRRIRRFLKRLKPFHYVYGRSIVFVSHGGSYPLVLPELAPYSLSQFTRGPSSVRKVHSGGSSYDAATLRRLSALGNGVDRLAFGHRNAGFGISELPNLYLLEQGSKVAAVVLDNEGNLEEEVLV